MERGEGAPERQHEKASTTFPAIIILPSFATNRCASLSMANGNELPWARSYLEYAGEYSDNIFGFNRKAAKKTKDTKPAQIRENLAAQYHTVFTHVDTHRVKVEVDLTGIPQASYTQTSFRPSSDMKRILLPTPAAIASNGGRPFYIEVYDEEQARAAVACGWQDLPGVCFTPGYGIPNDLWTGKQNFTTVGARAGASAVICSHEGATTPTRSSSSSSSSSGSGSGSSSGSSGSSSGSGSGEISADWWQKWQNGAARTYDCIKKLWEDGDGELPAMKTWTTRGDQYNRVAQYYVLIVHGKINDTKKPFSVTALRNIKDKCGMHERESWVQYALRHPLP